ncbi:MAG: dihydroorotase [Bacteroidetes bacterium]|nr:dihydroorotase [Bacteroidota bacterium]
MKSYLIKEVNIVNEGEILEGDVLIKNGRIEQIGSSINATSDLEIDGSSKHLFPGLIDDQVHFREPGLTHKAEIYTEAKAAIAGGVTSFMEMPNTKPAALTQELLEEKYNIGAQRSLANYSFYMGASNENYEQLMRTDPSLVCGLKIFMGSSTGNMLVDDAQVLESIFSSSEMLIATHCEDEKTVKSNEQIFRDRFGEEVEMFYHPEIRSVEACLISSSLAIELAKKHNTRLHILHITTADETVLFSNDIPLSEKRITSEVCVHHLWFDSDRYEDLGARIKCNPAIKDGEHQIALMQALKDGQLDIVATDHAPHTLEEKNNTYFNCPSGLPLIQHSLVAMLEFFHEGKLSLEEIVEKMCHNPAICFQVENRGYIREGYHADLVLLNLDEPWTVESSNILYKCGWSPFEGEAFSSRVLQTFVNGHLAYDHGSFDESQMGQRLTFSRS